MSLRKMLKRFVYGHCPGFAGRIPYFGSRVFFPKNAYIFDILCNDGIYECEILRQIERVLKPGSWYFDVGANIGLMSIPILQMRHDIHVLSLEPSRNSYPYLKRTWTECPWRERWNPVFKAVGSQVGQTEFALSEYHVGGFDGIKSTGRVKMVASETVPMTTLDEEWKALGRPLVSCIKMDIEGAEMQALAGGSELVRATRPYVFVEWFEQNFRCFGTRFDDLLKFADAFGYEVLSIPGLTAVKSSAVLLLQMARTASFVMVPQDQ